MSRIALLFIIITFSIIQIKSNQINFISGDKAHSTQTQMTIKHTHIIILLFLILFLI